MGHLDNTLLVFTTDNGAEAISFPDGRVTPFLGQKGESTEGGHRADGHPVAGLHQARYGHRRDDGGARLGADAGRYRWRPKRATTSRSRSRPASTPASSRPPDGGNQREFLEGKTDKSARDCMFYYSCAQLAAVRYQNSKFTYCGSQPGATGWLLP
jgi:hypothetical protein